MRSSSIFKSLVCFIESGMLQVKRLPPSGYRLWMPMIDYAFALRLRTEKITACNEQATLSHRRTLTRPVSATDQKRTQLLVRTVGTTHRRLTFGDRGTRSQLFPESLLWSRIGGFPMMKISSLNIETWAQRQTFSLRTRFVILYDVMQFYCPRIYQVPACHTTFKTQ